MYAVKMEEAFNKGDKAAYARLNEEVKGLCDSITAKQPKNPKQQALTKPVSSSVAKAVTTPTHLPSGITIESVSSVAKRDQESTVSVSQKPAESTLTVSAVQAKTLSVSSGATIPSLPKSTNGSSISHVSLPISSTSKGLLQVENIVPKQQLAAFSSPSHSKVSSGVDPKEPTKGFTITPSQTRLPVSHAPSTTLSTQLSVSSLLSSSSNPKPNELPSLPSVPCFQKSDLDLALPTKSQNLSDGFGVQQSMLKVKSAMALMEPQLHTKEALPVSRASPRSDLGSPHNLKKEVSILQVPDVPKQQPTSFKKEIILSSKCDSTSSVPSSRPSVENNRVMEERHPLNLTPTMNFNHPSKLQVSDAEKHQSHPYLDLGLTLDMFNQPNNLTSSMAKEVSLDDTLKSIFAQQQPLSKRECTTNQQRAPIPTSKSIDSVLDFSVETKQPSCSNPLQIKKETALAYQILPDSSGQSFLSELSNKSSYQQQDQFMNNKPSSNYSDVQLPYSSFDAELAALVSELASSAGQASDFGKTLTDEPLQLTQAQSEQGNSKGPNVFSLEKDSRGFSPSQIKSDPQISVPQMQPINFTAQSLVSGIFQVMLKKHLRQTNLDLV